MEVVWAVQRLRAETAPDPVGAGSNTLGVGSVERITGAAVGEGCSGAAHVSKGSTCDEGHNASGVRSIGNGAGGGVGGCGDRASEGGVLWRGERRTSSPSPSSLSSSALHHLFTAFLVCLDSGGEGTSKVLGSEGLGSEGSDSESLGAEPLGQ
jgi:hypothetical protein